MYSFNTCQPKEVQEKRLYELLEVLDSGAQYPVMEQNTFGFVCDPVEIIADACVTSRIQSVARDVEPTEIPEGKAFVVDDQGIY